MSDAPQKTDASAAVLRPLRALEILSSENPSHTELARALGVHPRTSRRLLEAMRAAGYVSEVAADPGRYRLTPRLAAVGNRALGRRELSQLAFSHLEALAADITETAYLSIPYEEGALTILHASPPRRLAVRVALGDLDSYWDSAAGRVLLASDPSRLEAVLHPPDPKTERPEDPGDLLIDLTRVRNQGYAVVSQDEADQVGILSLAAPARDASGKVIAAIAVSGPAPRMEDRVDETGERLVAEATSLSDELGSPETLSPAQPIGRTAD